MVDSTLDQVQRLVDQLTPRDQVRLLTYLAHRLDQVVATTPFVKTEELPQTDDAWKTLFRLGDALAATDTPEVETLTAAVLAMRR